MRLPRFRLSTLMLLVVIVALATALVVQQWRSAERERLQAVRAEMALWEAMTVRQVVNTARTTPPAPPAPGGGMAK